VTVRTVAPAEALVPYLRRLEVVETSAPITRTLLPETGLILGVRYAGESAVDGSTQPLAPAVLTGFRSTARLMRTDAGGGVVVAKFTETGAAALLGIPPDHLFGAIVPLEDVLPAAQVVHLVDEVGRASDDQGRAAAMERFLVSRLRPDPDPLVTEAIRLLRASHGSARIGPLARGLGVSQDLLEKRFRRRVGATPKQLASILRFRRAMALHRSRTSLGELALDAGYYDQAHFTREFRVITRSSPGALLSSAEYC